MSPCVKLYSVRKKDNNVCLVPQHLIHEQTASEINCCHDGVEVNEERSSAADDRQTERFGRITKEPWDIGFDDTGRLWVVQPCKHHTVSVYTCREEDDSLKISVADTDEDIKLIVEKLNTNWDFFEAAASVPHLFDALEKMRADRSKYDNVRLYRERKQERIQGKKLLQLPQAGSASVTIPNLPPEKKVKTS